MTLNYTAVMYRPTYLRLGVPVTITLADLTALSFTGLDKTGGVRVTDDHLSLQQITPACNIMAADLFGAGKLPEDLEGASLTMSGNEWRIQNAFVKPSPNGEQDGEVSLILAEAE